MSEIIQAWPRLLSVQLSARYLSVGKSTIRDYLADGLLTVVEMPGSTLRASNGQVVARSKSRKIHKILIAREDLDALVDRQKGGAA